MNRDSLRTRFERGGWIKSERLQNLFSSGFCNAYLYEKKLIIGGDNKGLNFSYIVNYSDIETIDISSSEVDIYLTNDSEITIEIY